MLYGRMLFSMVVSLFSSRIVLNALGVNDYGIYGLVGGIVMMFSFLNASMSSATSRYITVSMVNGDENLSSSTFRSAMIIHIAIAFIVLILAETVGLWFVNNKLVIATSRLYAANWVYQFSVIASILGITQVPYSAVLISQERFDLYAKLEILSSMLKLVAALLLLVSIFDNLIFYSFLILLFSAVTLIIARLICLHLYPISRFKWRWNKEVGKGLLNFSGWNLYSQFCFVFRQQGTNILLNIFGGTAVNAAASLAATIQSLIESASGNLITASRPQIISQHAVGHYKDMISLMKNMTILASVLYCMIAIPFIAELDYILHLWLKVVPEYTVPFCCCIVILNFISLNSNIIYLGIQADGRVKNYSFLAGTSSLIVVPIIWWMFKNGYSLVWAYGVPITFSGITYCICMGLFHAYVKEFPPFRYAISTIGKTILSISPCLIVVGIIRFCMPQILSRVVITVLLCVLILSAVAFLFLLDKNGQKRTFSYIRGRLKF